MTLPVLVPIVEGQGEVAAVPLLLRRIAIGIGGVSSLEVRRPIRVSRSKILKAGELERYVELAARSAGPAGAVLVLLDADDDCPAELGALLLARASEVRVGLTPSVVLAKHEFESWFLAAAVSLRGQRGLEADLEAPGAPETISDAKGWLQRHRTDGFAYSPTTDQPALAAVMDLQLARAGAPSFDKLWRDLERLLGAAPSGFAGGA